MLNRRVLLFSISLVFIIFLGLGLLCIFWDLDYYVYLSLFVVLSCNKGFELNNMYSHTYVLYNSLDISIYFWYW